MVEDLFIRMEHSGIGAAAECMKQFDDRTMSCVIRYTPVWGEELGELIAGILKEGEDRAYKKWRRGNIRRWARAGWRGRG